MPALHRNIWFSAIMLLGVLPGNALEEIPARTVQAVDALSGLRWDEIEPGLSHLGAEAGAISVSAFMVDTDRFRFSISVQREGKGETAEDSGRHNNAVLTVNGGFFGEKEPGKDLFPVGLLRVGGNSLSQAWTSQGGYVVVENDGLAIVPSGEGIADSVANVVQSRPVMIEPGGRWAMNTNQEYLRRRTLICLLPDGDVVLIAVTGIGLSLFEAGWLLREPAVGGYFACDAAIALDGGGSTQFWLDGPMELSIRGETPVQNFLHVLRRK
jgi:exopolysaccharide biosynthesis protein